MIQPSQILTFHLTCAEPRAWVVLKSDDQEPRVLEMERRNATAWSASADLIPGDYRCRYYCGDDRNVNYYGPARIAGGIECGMDTQISVGLSFRCRVRK
jgi:hypothetical protein